MTLYQHVYKPFTRNSPEAPPTELSCSCVKKKKRKTLKNYPHSLQQTFLEFTSLHLYVTSVLL